MAIETHGLSIADMYFIEHYRKSDASHPASAAWSVYPPPDTSATLLYRELYRRNLPELRVMYAHLGGRYVARLQAQDITFVVLSSGAWFVWFYDKTEQYTPQGARLARNMARDAHVLSLCLAANIPVYHLRDNGESIGRYSSISKLELLALVAWLARYPRPPDYTPWLQCVARTWPYLQVRPTEVAYRAAGIQFTVRCDTWEYYITQYDEINLVCHTAWDAIPASRHASYHALGTTSRNSTGPVWQLIGLLQYWRRDPHTPPLFDILRRVVALGIPNFIAPAPARRDRFIT